MKKAIKIILIVLAVLLVVLIAVPFLFKDKILTTVKSEINNNIQAKVDFSNFGLTIFSSFPNLTLTLDNLSVVGVDEFEGDTLAGVGNTSITVDIMSVITGGQMEIRSVELNRARLHLLVLENGKANWDIATKPSADSAAVAEEPTQFKAALRHYAIRESRLLYEDRSLGFTTLLDQFHHEGKGDFTEALFTLETRTGVEKLTLGYGGINYLSQVRADINANLEMDMQQSKYTFKENTIQLNELVFGIDGFVAMPGENIDMDLKFDAAKNDFRNFISMIPGVYRKDFDKVKSSGTLAFNGFAKGTYSETTMPGFGLTLTIENGMFQYPDLPTAINHVKVNLNIQNPDGVPDHTVINLKQLHAEMGSEPFDARLLVKTPVSDPDIDASVKGRIDLANVARLVPLEPGTNLRGVVNAQVTARGRLSSIENRRYEEFEAGGNLLVNDLNYVSNDFKQGISIQIGELVFNPKNITLNQLDMQMGKSDIKASGWLDNFLSYLFKENELLKGTLDIRSNTIDLNELMSDSETPAAADTTPMEVLQVPANIDFLVTANVGKVIYDDLTLESAKGNVAIRDQSLGLNDVSFKMLDGQVGMNGLYESKNVKKPVFFFDLDLTQLDIRKTYDTFIAVQKLAPIAERCQGKYSAMMDVRGELDAKMEPVMTSLSGGGKLTTSQVTVENFPPLVKLADALKMDQFKKINPSNLNLSFKFENGRVSIAPFDMKVAGINSTISGSNGFDETIDYNMDLKIPTAMMGSSATGVVSGLLTKANQAAGTNLSMGKEVKVTAKITGTVKNPKVETGIKDMASSAATDIKEQLREELDTKKKELEDKARAEADRLKKEAEDKARAEADRLKKEAEAKAKAEADRLKKEAEDKLKKEAEDKLKDLFKKPK